MSQSSLVQPALLSKINEREVLRAIQRRGPMSRAEVARDSGISAPTASRAVEALLRAGFLEEGDAPEFVRGRPARKLRLANETSQVLGLVLDARECRVVSASLDGSLHRLPTRAFTTPPTYDELLGAAEAQARTLMARPGVTTLGLGISMPGLLDYRSQQGVLSPNLSVTDQHSPSRDLAERLGTECVLVQESHALCLAERHFGAARGIDDFAMLDVSTGIGLGVMMGGRLLTGHSGTAGEIGHIPVVAEGRKCGCGSFGCLETVASDTAIARDISERLGRRVNVDEALALAAEGDAVAVDALHSAGRCLAVGMATVLNLFNPSTLFVHGRLFDADEAFLPLVIEETRRRALRPAFEACTIVRAHSSKRQGAIAAIIEHLTDSVVPQMAVGL